MRNAITTAQFGRDVRLARKRGEELARLHAVIALLLEGLPLPRHFKDHPLGGEWQHHRECHIQPDWLLIYKIIGADVYLVRTGTHSDLF